MSSKGRYVPKGMIAAMPTPFHKDESINYEAYKTLIDYLIDNGIHCVLAGGSTGEYHVMSLEERKKERHQNRLRAHGEACAGHRGDGLVYGEGYNRADELCG
jgi:ADP-heptose:LPS heptosyltransferase